MGTEPLKTLGDFRSGRVLGWNARSDYKRELMFGWNLVRAGGLCVCARGCLRGDKPSSEADACRLQLFSHCDDVMTLLLPVKQRLVWLQQTCTKA